MKIERKKETKKERKKVRKKERKMEKVQASRKTKNEKRFRFHTFSILCPAVDHEAS
jgi:hypothetical protein